LGALVFIKKVGFPNLQLQDSWGERKGAIFWSVVSLACLMANGDKIPWS